MDADHIFEQIIRKRSFLCIGLDPEISRLPENIMKHELPVFEFNRQIIDATHDVVIAYKPNLAFYEVLGAQGWQQFELTVEYIRRNHPEIMIIADAKRGDIGNTARKYAETFFSRFNCDAVTVAPYMGHDSVKPFLEFEGKWVILLAMTSNTGADDFQFLPVGDNDRLFEKIIRISSGWGTTGNMMYVAGGTRASLLVKVRAIIPDHFLLIPGIGAQGGDLTEVAQYGMNNRCGLIVNSSRAIIYADSTKHFAEVAREKALEVQEQMRKLLERIL